jgi:hypothetical protein
MLAVNDEDVFDVEVPNWSNLSLNESDGSANAFGDRTGIFKYNQSVSIYTISSF